MPDTTRPTLDGTRTVNDVLARIPASSRLLLDLGLDTCCGGGLTLAEACDDAGVDLDRVLRDLGAVQSDRS